MFWFVFFISLFYCPIDTPIMFSTGLLGDIYLTYFNSEEFLNIEGQITDRDALISKDSSVIISTQLDGLYGQTPKIEYLYYRGFHNNCFPYNESPHSDFYYSSSSLGSYAIFVQATIIDINDKSLSSAQKELKQNWSRLRGNELERFLLYTIISIVSEDWVFVIHLRENLESFVISEEINKINTLKKSLKININ